MLTLSRSCSLYVQILHRIRVVEVDVLHPFDEDGDQAVPNDHGGELHQLHHGLQHHPLQLLGLLYSYTAVLIYIYT